MQYSLFNAVYDFVQHHFACVSSTATRPLYSPKNALFLLWPNPFFVPMTVLALSGGVAHALAADLAVSGNAAQSPLKASTNADIVRALTLLRKQTEADGTTRIIIELRIAFTPEGGLTAAAAAQQRNEIARVQLVVLEKVPSLKQRPEKIKRFENSPFMALEVNATELEVLANLAEIASIAEDRLAAPTLGIGVVKPDNK